MQYKLLKDLPTFKVGTIAWKSKHENLVTEIDGKTIVMYATSTLAKFPSILTEWFEPIEEKLPLEVQIKRFYELKAGDTARYPGGILTFIKMDGAYAQWYNEDNKIVIGHDGEYQLGDDGIYIPYKIKNEKI